MNIGIHRVLVLLLFPLTALAQSEPQIVHLWKDGAPGFESRKDEPEQAQDWWIRNIHNPSITIFRPPEGKANGCAVLVAPGGGFRALVFNSEGKDVARFLNTLGVTVFVLKYRLPGEEHSPYTMANVREDAYRAMRLVRSRATEFQIDPHRIGILGFSVGGSVVMMVAFDKGDGDPKAADPVDRVNGRPDFEMLVYPGGSKAPATVPADSPPAFLLCANDDEYACDQLTMDLLQDFRAAKVSVEAHFLPQGKHGFNMGDRSTFAAVRNWPQRMADWLADRGFLKASTPVSQASAPK